MSDDGTPRQGLAQWFTTTLVVVAVIYGAALVVQLFARQLLPLAPDSPDPFASLPSFVYALEAAVAVAATCAAIVRTRAPRRSVVPSLAAAIVLLFACPCTIASVIWLLRDFRLEMNWARSSN